MEIHLLGHVTPIFMIGESHSLAFRDLLFRPDWSHETFICRTRFLPSLVASEYSVDSAISVPLAEALKAEGVLDAALRPGHLYADPSAAYIAGKPLIAPPMVFFAGDTDLVHFIKKLGLEYDFELPEDPGYGTDYEKQPVSLRDVQAELERILAPFLKAVRMLADVQLSRIMVHCIPPRNQDDIAAGAFTGAVRVPGAVRSKVVVLANRLLRQGCVASGIGFIDTWELTSENGFLRPDMVLDGIHFNRKAAMVSLAQIARQLFDHTSGTHNQVRYTQLAAQAESFAGDTVLDEAWRTHGVVSIEVGAEETAELSRNLVFAEGIVNSLARTDWVGWPLDGRPGVKLAVPDAVNVMQAHQMLSTGDAQAALHAGSERALTVVSFRPIAYSGPSATCFDNRTVPVPAGVRLGVLSLSGDMQLVFERSDGAVDEVQLAKGTLVIFDPQRGQCRVSGVTQNMRLVELVCMPRLAEQAFRVTWAGLANWPCDPYQYSVTEMCAIPPHLGDSVSARARWN